MQAARRAKAAGSTRFCMGATRSGPPQAGKSPLAEITQNLNLLLLCMQAARRAKAAGSTRFCMGAAWRGPSQVGKGQWARVLGMVKEIRGMGMEVCTTLGMLTPEQARLHPR